MLEIGRGLLACVWKVLIRAVCVVVAQHEVMMRCGMRMKDVDVDVDDDERASPCALTHARSPIL